MSESLLSRSRAFLLEHPALGVFLIAIAFRSTLALVVSVRYDGHLFGDDELYLRLIRDFSVGENEAWSEYHRQLWSLSYGFLLPGLVGFSLGGGRPTFVLLITAFVGSLLPVLSVCVLRRLVRTGFAVVVGISLALMPSQILWSSLLLKDTYIAFGLVTIALLLRWWSAQISLVRTLIGGAGFLVLMTYISRIRVHSMTVAAIAALTVVAFGRSRMKTLRIAVVAGVFVLLPYSVGGGLGGMNLARGLSQGLESQRTKGAIDAKTAVVAVPTTTVVSSTNSAPPPPGLLPATMESPSDRLVDELKYLPRGLKVMLIDPTVTQLSRSPSLRFALAEHIIWYPALVLALYGALRTRRWTTELTFSGLLFLGLCSMWGLAEGNFGTAFRHRTEFVWVIFVFAGLGLETLRRDLESRRTRTTINVANQPTGS